MADKISIREKMIQDFEKKAAAAEEDGRKKASPYRWGVAKLIYDELEARKNDKPAYNATKLIKNLGPEFSALTRNEISRRKRIWEKYQDQATVNGDGTVSLEIQWHVAYREFSGKASSPEAAERNQEIREFAAEHDIGCPARGRIPQAVKDAFDKSQREAPEDSETEPDNTPEPEDTEIAPDPFATARLCAQTAAETMEALARNLTSEAAEDDEIGVWLDEILSSADKIRGMMGK